MDLGDFGKAVRRAADRIAVPAEEAAPVFKVGAMVVLPFATAGAAAPFLPFLVALPPEAFLPLPVSVPLAFLSPNFRGDTERHAEESAPAAAPLLVSRFLNVQGA